MPQSGELLNISDIVKTFSVKVSAFGKKKVHALNNVSLKVEEGQTLSLVGESGCGKTTLGKVVAGLYDIDKGKIFFQNEDISGKNSIQRGEIQKNIQMIFQDPYASLNPRKKIYKILEQPLKRFTNLNQKQRYDKIVETCENVGIDLSYLHRYPHQFSGGQRQRIAIARAIILNPKLVLADEPISALDVSIQAQILNLMMELQEKMSLTYLFITHDISVVKHISDYVAVMYLGEIVEYGKKSVLFEKALHPYTQLLFSAVPDINKPFLNESVLESGEIPSPIDLPEGCFFASRCPFKDERCLNEHPKLEQIEGNYMVRCFKVGK